jgi:beta-lactamase class A
MKKIHFKSFILPLIILLLLGLLLHSYSSNRYNIVVKQGGRLTNPLLRHVKFRELRSFRDKIEELIKKEKEDGLAEEVSVYFRSLSDGAWYGINERGKFCPASILKVPIMMACFKIAEKDPDILNKKITYKIPANQAYFPGVKENSSAEIGKYYSVDELIKFMIAESDNSATMLLIEHLPKDALKKTFEQFGIDPAVSADEDFVSLKIVTSFFRVLYNASYLNEKFSEKALRYLAETTYRGGIVSGVPGNITVAHKFGERFFEATGKKQMHEVGIVYYPRNPYILAVMTKDSDYGRLTKVIKDISELVYKEIDAQYKEKSADKTAFTDTE